MKILSVEHFNVAVKSGTREYSKRVSKGQSGYLPCLEELLENVEVVSQVDLGIVDIPIKKIVGTHSHTRSIAFASNFMPLMYKNTEFADKWIALCEINLESGFRDPLKVYEYLNWFYVVEGNKRTSILKYFDAFSYQGKVTRLIPKYDSSDLNIRIYYKFMDFYKKTGINCIWFSKESSFEKLLQYLARYEPVDFLQPDKYKCFVGTVYTPFRTAYHELGGGRLSLTTGDSFLEYIKLYGIPSDITEEELKVKLKGLLTELENYKDWEVIDVQTGPLPYSSNKLASTISNLVRPKKKLKVAFAYAKSISQSNWTYAHERGRLYTQDVLKDQIETSYEENIPENMNAYENIKQLAESGNDIIFSTSPAFLNAALKTALEYPHVRFFNCSESRSFKHVRTYFGRIYEARFLAGMIAGTLTQSDILGCVGTYPIPGVISGINAFTIGARMVNPRVKVHVGWTNCWNSHEFAADTSTSLIQQGADVISHQNTLADQSFSKEYGVYSMVCSIDKKNCVPDAYLAAPVWNWGVFYKKMIESILNDVWKSSGDVFAPATKPVNFWWGLDSGIVDIYCPEDLIPVETRKLVSLMKGMISANTFHPFTGPIYDQKGSLRIAEGKIAAVEQIINMDWFTDTVIDELPKAALNVFDSSLSAEMLEQDNA